jgi:hypothetical protein
MKRPNCSNHGLDYMNFRSWIGLWTTLFLLIMVVTDASCLVKYITRFTGNVTEFCTHSSKIDVNLLTSLEESFAALIGIIFIYEAFNKIIDINKHRPARLQTNQFLPSNCSCTMWNGTRLNQANMTISVRNRSDKCEDFELNKRKIIFFFSSLVLRIRLINSAIHRVVHSMTKLMFPMFFSFRLFFLRQHSPWLIH